MVDTASPGHIREIFHHLPHIAGSVGDHGAQLLPDPPLPGYVRDPLAQSFTCVSLLEWNASNADLGSTPVVDVAWVMEAFKNTKLLQLGELGEGGF
jgi:hypothetical protein